MGCSILNMLMNIGTTKGSDCRNYGNLKKNALPIHKSVSYRRMFEIKGSTNDAGNVASVPPIPSLEISRQPCRNHRLPFLRSPFQETSLSPGNFVYPLFIHEGEEDTPIGAMPGCYMLGWRHGLLEVVSKARDVGVNSIMLFPKVPDELKTLTGDEAYNDLGLVPRTIRFLKDNFPDLIIYTDVSLRLYSSNGHDNIVKDGVIMNDETVHQLCKQAVSQARAGADVVSPSAMTDGCVRAIRSVLDAEGFQHVFIMSYTAKFESSLDYPFLKAFNLNLPFRDPKNYLTTPKNYEALKKLHEDESQGADIFLVTPGLPHIHITKLLRDNSPFPIAAYQVSREYSMIKAGGVSKVMDEQELMMQSLMRMRGAGADIILTYFALQAARCLCGEK